MSTQVNKDPDTLVNEGELIVAPAPTTLTLFDDRRTQFVTNFAGDKVATWRFTSLCKSGMAKSLQDYANQEIELKWYYCHPVQIKGGTAGEVIDCIRTVLVTPSNEMLETVSDGVAGFVQDLRRFFGDGPIDPPQKVRVIRKQTRSKFHTILLEPVL